MRPDGGSRASLLHRFLRQAQILRHQRRSEARLIVPIGGARRHRPRHRAIAGKRPGIAGGGGADIKQCLMRKPQFFRKNKGFRGDNHGRCQHHIIAELHTLPRASNTTMNDIAPHLLQDGLGARKMLWRAAHHEGERAGFRPHRPARDRRIHKGAARFRGDIARGRDINRGAINQQRIRRSCRRHGASAKPGIAHMLARRQHGDDIFRPACRIGGIGRRFGTIRGDGGNGRRH